MNTPYPIRVLLVSGDAAYSRLIDHIIKKGNNSTESVISAPEAMKRLGTGDFDVLLFEVGIHADLEAFSMVRRNVPSVPAVILTDDDALALEALKLGAQDSVVKGQVEEKFLTRTMRFAMERKRAEDEELKSTRLQLIQAEKLDSVGRLAAGVAHEVKNPLATIKMGVDYLEKKMNGDKNTAMILHEIDEAVRRANTVIRGLLDFSVTHELNEKLISVASLVEMSLVLVRHDLDLHQIRLVREIATNLAPLKLDINKVEQVLINVFTNAIYAMKVGGVLTVRVYTKRERGGHQWNIIEVDDTGTGIPEKAIANLFDPFFTTKPIGEGSGLGLTVCQKIMELHGGVIAIANRPEGGARVTLRFRALEGEEVAA